MEIQTRPTDTFRNDPEGKIDTLFGEFRYSVGATTASIDMSSPLVLNRVEYTFRAYLKLDENGKWVFREYNLSRKDYKSPSDSARDKVRNEIIPFICNWLNINPEILIQARRRFLESGVKSIRENAEMLHQEAKQREDDASYIERCLYDFNEGIGIDWVDMEDVIVKRNKYVR